MDSWDAGGSFNDNSRSSSPGNGKTVSPMSAVTGRASAVLRTTSNSSLGNAKSAFTEDTLMEYIPDLEEVQEEDLTMAVAAAPEYKIHHITSLKELDADLLQSKPFSTVDGVNLKKLCKYIVPERFLLENDEFWDWENTYTEIASEFRKSFAKPMTKPKEARADSNETDGSKVFD